MSENPDSSQIEVSEVMKKINTNVFVLLFTALFLGLAAARKPNCWTTFTGELVDCPNCKGYHPQLGVAVRPTTIW